MLVALRTARAGDLGHAGETLRAMRIAANERGGHGVLEDELLQSAGLQHDRVFVEGAYFAGDLNAVHQMYGDVFLAQESCLKERFLNVAGEHARSYLSRMRSRLESS